MKGELINYSLGTVGHSEKTPPGAEGFGAAHLRHVLGQFTPVVSHVRVGRRELTLLVATAVPMSADPLPLNSYGGVRIVEVDADSYFEVIYEQPK